MTKDKKNSVYFFLLSLLMLAGVIFLMKFQCFDTCSYELRTAFLKPLMNLLFGVTLASGILLCFSSNFFKKWLTRIAIWYVPLSVIMLAYTEASGGSILTLHRTDAAVWWASGLVVLTALFVLYQKWQERRTA